MKKEPRDLRQTDSLERHLLGVEQTFHPISRLGPMVGCCIGSESSDSDSDYAFFTRAKSLKQAQTALVKPYNSEYTRKRQASSELCNH